MRIGLYGGSFDPIHNGHIRPVWEAKRALGLERVIYLPTAHPPHKAGRVYAPAAARYAMVELALLWENELFASAFELGGDTAYTIDTVRHMTSTLPGDELVLLIGSDAFAGLGRWRAWRELLAEIEVAVLLRPGWEPAAVMASLPVELRAAAFERPARKAVRFVDNQPVMASSTAIREQLGRDHELQPGLVPSLVLDYIRKYELYR